MSMFGNVELSVEAQVAMNMGDEDWEDLLPAIVDGCHRRATCEVERSRVELEPNIDKFCDERLHLARYA